MKPTVLLIVYFINILSSSLGSDSVDNVTDTKKLIVNNKYETDEIFEEIKKEGENILLNCEFSPVNEQLNKIGSIEWLHNGTPILEEKSTSRSFIKRWKKLAENKEGLQLTIRMLNSAHDSGLYECIVRYNGHEDTLKRRVKVFVLKVPTWVNNDKVVSATIGEPLTINCEAKGLPKPYVTIQLTNGSELPPEFTVVKSGEGENENTISLSNVATHHRGTEIKCQAGQILDDVGDNPMVVKMVTIDVYFKPTFQGGDSVELYGILNSNMTINCVVLDSNPPVTSLTFYELSTNPDTNELTREELKDGYKNYKLETVITSQMATLFIPMLNESHFTENNKYECLGRNKQNLESTQSITLNQIQTPVSPETRVEQDDHQSITFKIDNVVVEKPAAYAPITKYRIKYVKEEHLNTTDWDEVDMKEFDASSENTYKISNLSENTSYVFRFQGVNAAGEGDWSPVPFSARTQIKQLNNAFHANCHSFSKYCLAFVVLVVCKLHVSE